MAYKPAPVLLIGNIVKMENEQDQKQQNGDKFEEIAIIGDIQQGSRPIIVTRKSKIPFNSEDEVLVNGKRKDLVQGDEVLD